MNYRDTVLLFLLLMNFILLHPLEAVSLADRTYGSVTVDEVTSIYDGDTFRANIKAYPGLIGYRIGIRINGIDTPELRAKCPQEKSLALKAKQFSVSHLRSAKTVELKNMKRGKYFRIVADVYVDGKDLGQMLIDNRLAVPYAGGHKAKDWCR